MFFFWRHLFYGPKLIKETKQKMFYPLLRENVFSLSFIVWFMLICFRRIKGKCFKGAASCFYSDINQITQTRSHQQMYIFEDLFYPLFTFEGAMLLSVTLNRLKLASTILPLKFGLVFLMLNILTGPFFFLLLNKEAKSNDKGDLPRKTHGAIKELSLSKNTKIDLWEGHMQAFLIVAPIHPWHDSACQGCS